MVQTQVWRAEGGASPSGWDHGPLDMDHLLRQSLGDSGLQEEILRIYADMSVIYLSRIQASATEEDLARGLHTLKSAAAGIGARRVEALARAAEADLSKGGVAEDRLQALAAAVDECNAFIRELIEDRAA